jgi:hypothetical protein
MANIYDFEDIIAYAISKGYHIVQAIDILDEIAPRYGGKHIEENVLKNLNKNTLKVVKSFMEKENINEFYIKSRLKK